MASFKYLWLNRAKFQMGSTEFYRSWGKRIFSLFELIKRNRCRWKLIRKGASIHETAEIGGVKITGGLKFLTVGQESFVGRVTMNIHDSVVIGNRVCINDGVEILTASHDVEDPQWGQVKAPIIINDYAWIGTGAMILPGVTIGKGAVVGARSVVTKSVLPGQIVVGNPARPSSKMRPIDLTYNPCEFLAENRAWLKG